MVENRLTRAIIMAFALALMELDASQELWKSTGRHSKERTTRSWHVVSYSPPWDRDRSRKEGVEGVPHPRWQRPQNLHWSLRCEGRIWAWRAGSENPQYGNCNFQPTIILKRNACQNKVFWKMGWQQANIAELFSKTYLEQELENEVAGRGRVWFRGGFLQLWCSLLLFLISLKTKNVRLKSLGDDSGILIAKQKRMKVAFWLQRYKKRSNRTFPYSLHSPNLAFIDWRAKSGNKE